MDDVRLEITFETTSNTDVSIPADGCIASCNNWFGRVA